VALPEGFAAAEALQRRGSAQEGSADADGMGFAERVSVEVTDEVGVLE
jgi:hypothetical protein